MTRASSQAGPPHPRILKDVTLAAADCVRPELAARALEICLDKCAFADAVLFSDVAVPGRFRCETIAPLHSINDYTRFCLKEMPSRIATGFVLVVQWDGYITDPAAWSPNFIRYDYIGAPYLDPGGGQHWVVGNGGFSLRSRRLLAALASLPIVPGLNEDRLISQTFRAVLERDHGIRFAPEKVANRFSFEQRRPDGATFGFHGLENLHRVETDDQVIAMIDRLTAAERTDGRLFPPINECLKDNRLDLAVQLFRRARGTASSATVRAIVTRVFRSETFAKWMVDWLEELDREPHTGA